MKGYPSSSSFKVSTACYLNKYRYHSLILAHQEHLLPLYTLSAGTLMFNKSHQPNEVTPFTCACYLSPYLKRYRYFSLICTANTEHDRLLSKTPSRQYHGPLAQEARLREDFMIGTYGQQAHKVT